MCMTKMVWTRKIRKEKIGITFGKCEFVKLNYRRNPATSGWSVFLRQRYIVLDDSVLRMTNIPQTPTINQRSSKQTNQHSMNRSTGKNHVIKSMIGLRLHLIGQNEPEKLVGPKKINLTGSGRARERASHEILRYNTRGHGPGGMIVLRWDAMFTERHRGIFWNILHFRILLRRVCCWSCFLTDRGGDRRFWRCAKRNPNCRVSLSWWYLLANHLGKIEIWYNYYMYDCRLLRFTCVTQGSRLSH